MAACGRCGARVKRRRDGRRRCVGCGFLPGVGGLDRSGEMKGNNTIEMNAATVMTAVQYYFDTVLFKEGASPKVTNIEGYAGTGSLFKVYIKGDEVAS